MLVLGTDLSFAHEGMDAPNVSLPLGQSALLKAVLAVVEAPLVVVMLSAQPLDISAQLGPAFSPTPGHPSWEREQLAVGPGQAIQLSAANPHHPNPDHYAPFQAL